MQSNTANFDLIQTAPIGAPVGGASLLVLVLITKPTGAGRTGA
jgi:hypothetical protein